MPVLTITNFIIFANVIVAACRLATSEGAVDRLAALAAVASGAKSLDAALGTTGLGRVAAEMAAAAEEHARHFTHEGQARDDAIALFFQVAPTAFSDTAGKFVDAHLDPTLTTDQMVAAIKASPLAKDFSETPLAEQFFRSVTHATLRVMLNDPKTVELIAPAIHRQSLKNDAEILVD
jgi:hypothetical protein